MKDPYRDPENWLSQLALYSDLVKFGHLAEPDLWEFIYASSNQPYNVYVPATSVCMRWPYSPYMYVCIRNGDEYYDIYPRLLDNRMEPIGYPYKGDLALLDNVLEDLRLHMSMPYTGTNTEFRAALPEEPTWWNFICYTWNVYARLIDDTEKGAKAVRTRFTQQTYSTESFVC